MKFLFKGNAIKSLSNKINKMRDICPTTVKEVLENATIEAIDTAVSKTPPNEYSNNGTGTITGTLKSAWSRDSIIEAKKNGDGKYITTLCNKEYYASFVNDGHIMDKHFVPGLIINPYTGLLEKMPAGMDGGIVVGTKTKYVVGKYMKENALITFYNSLNKQSKEILKRLENVK